MATTRQRLREETADLHAAAETYVRILDADATLEDYSRYLRAMAGFHASLEDAFAAHADLTAAGFDAAGRRRAHLAVADLVAIGAPTHTVACPHGADVVGSLAGLLGAAYVVEGSTLGGRYVLSRLPPVIAAWRGRATGFLEGYGDATGARWRAFAALLDRFTLGNADSDACVAGARATFEALVQWLATFETPLASRVRASA